MLNARPRAPPPRRLARRPAQVQREAQLVAGRRPWWSFRRVHSARAARRTSSQPGKLGVLADEVAGQQPPARAPSPSRRGRPAPQRRSPSGDRTDPSAAAARQETHSRDGLGGRDGAVAVASETRLAGETGAEARPATAGAALAGARPGRGARREWVASAPNVEPAAQPAKRGQQAHRTTDPTPGRRRQREPVHAAARRHGGRLVLRTCTVPAKPRWLLAISRRRQAQAREPRPDPARRGTVQRRRRRPARAFGSGTPSCPAGAVVRERLADRQRCAPTSRAPGRRRRPPFVGGDSPGGAAPLRFGRFGSVQGRRCDGADNETVSAEENTPGFIGRISPRAVNGRPRYRTLGLPAAVGRGEPRGSRRRAGAALVSAARPAA